MFAEDSNPLRGSDLQVGSKDMFSVWITSNLYNLQKETAEKKAQKKTWNDGKWLASLVESIQSGS